MCRQEQFPAAKLRWGYFFQIDTKGQGSLTKEIVKWQRDQELQALDRNLEGLHVGEHTHTGMGVFWVCVCDRIVFKLHCDDICTTLKM